MDLKKFIASLSNTPGISGMEKEVSQKIVSAWETLADEVEVDTLGNVIAWRRGKNSKHPPIMIAAHQDEIGFMVNEIDKDGFVRLEPIGGIDPRLLPGQEVVIWGREKVLGIVGAKPPHLQKPEEREKAIPLDKMFVDCGEKKESLTKKIQVGDPITFNQELEWFNENVCTGKSLDDRAGVASLHQALLELKGTQPEIDIAFVATVQEEVGVRGAITSSFRLKPCLGIAVDVGFAQRPGQEKELSIEANKGPALGIGPHVHPDLFSRLQGIAVENDIPFQMEPSPHPGGTDAYAIQMSRCGVATALLSIPLANMHSPLEVIDIRDVRRTGKLLARFCLQADVEFVEGLTCL